MRILKFLFYCSIVFLTGCMHYSIELKEDSDPFKPSFKLSEGIFFKKDALINSFGVLLLENNNRIVWEIFSDGVYVNEITYGEIPKGFREYVKANELKSNQTYKVSFRSGDYGGGLFFRILEKNGRQQIEILQK